MTMLKVALRCLARGWHVFPCGRGQKTPLVAGGFKAATNDEAAVRAWWEKWPEANVAIATGPSNLTVLDADHGLADADALRTWAAGLGLPPTYAVRTGRRPEFGVQMYFEGPRQSTVWEAAGVSGDIKSAGGYVMAAGCVHPDSGERYEVLHDRPVVAMPPVVREMRKPDRGPGAADDGGPITANRNTTLTSIAGKLRNAGLTHAALEAALLQVNADRCAPPLDDAEVKTIARNAAAWKLPEEPLGVTLGGAALQNATDAATGLQTPGRASLSSRGTGGACSTRRPSWKAPPTPSFSLTASCRRSPSPA